MRENFPQKKAGQSIGAGHLNDLSKVARRTGTPLTGSFTYNMGGGGYANPAPFMQRTFVVIGSLEDADEESSSSSSASSSSSSSEISSESLYHFGSRSADIYLIRPLYFDHTTNQWLADEAENPQELDAGATGQTFSEGDVVSAYWHTQRGAWIPLQAAAASIELVHGVVVESCNEDCNTYRVQLLRRVLDDSCVEEESSNSSSSSVSSSSASSISMA